jgi:hypothetical protein
MPATTARKGGGFSEEFKSATRGFFQIVTVAVLQSESMATRMVGIGFGLVSAGCHELAT